jgi:hypothetical protein
MTSSFQILSNSLFTDQPTIKLNSVDLVRERTIPTERPVYHSTQNRNRNTDSVVKQVTHTNLGCLEHEVGGLFTPPRISEFICTSDVYVQQFGCANGSACGHETVWYRVFLGEWQLFNASSNSMYLWNLNVYGLFPKSCHIVLSRAR